MKEYIKPEIEIVSLVADEAIASSELEIGTGTSGNPF